MTTLFLSTSLFGDFIQLSPQEIVSIHGHLNERYKIRKSRKSLIRSIWRLAIKTSISLAILRPELNEPSSYKHNGAKDETRWRSSFRNWHCCWFCSRGKDGQVRRMQDRPETSSAVSGVMKLVVMWRGTLEIRSNQLHATPQACRLCPRTVHFFRVCVFFIHLSLFHCPGKWPDEIAFRHTHSRGDVFLDAVNIEAVSVSHSGPASVNIVEHSPATLVPSQSVHFDVRIKAFLPFSPLLVLQLSNDRQVVWG